MSRKFLQYAHMAAFGRFVDTKVGPFTPGLNVVYGTNEAGKTTVRELIGGVLFGWPDARSVRNTYKPRSGGRDGALLFCDEDSGETGRIARARNAEGVSGDDAWVASVLGDIDKETYRTLFSLDSDELRALNATADVSAKLLTAGAGTKQSPAAALAALDTRIASYTSRAAGATHSFVHLNRELDAVKEALATERAEAESLKAEDVELRQMTARRDALSAKLAEANARIEELAACKGEVARIDEARAKLETELASARTSLRDLDARRASEATRPSLSATADAARLRAALTELAVQDDAARRHISDAREAYNLAAEHRRVLQQAASQADPHRGRTLRTAAIVAFCVAACAAVAAIACAATSVAPLVATIAVAVVAGLSVIAGGVCAYLGHKENARAASLAQAQAAYDDARIALDTAEGEQLLVAQGMQEAFAREGMQPFASTPRAALDMLPQLVQSQGFAAHARELAAIAQARQSEIEQELSASGEHRAQCLTKLGLPAQATALDVSQAMQAAVIARDEASEALSRTSARIGELGQLLAAGERETRLDELKTQRMQLVTRRNEASEELARLLLARRALGKATDAWLNRSQPEVYARASQLMVGMTNGAWTAVRLVPETGDVQAVDAMGEARDAHLLSTGTCQQLYLALRIALLECTPQVGANIPVIADDILVHFDDERRVAAAQAVAELSRTRQVIVFTCHKEVVEAFRHTTVQANVLGL